MNSQIHSQPEYVPKSANDGGAAAAAYSAECRKLRAALNLAEAACSAKDEALKLVKQRWTFDNGQRHTHTWHDWADCIAVIEKALASTGSDYVERLRKAEAFKTWVHEYLDTHGVPHHPPGTHGAEGCRIGDRMDWLMERLQEPPAVATVQQEGKAGVIDEREQNP